MDQLKEILSNGYILLYIALVVGCQALFAFAAKWRNNTIRKRRLEEKLPEPVLMNQAEKLSEVRKWALLESALLLFTVVVIPFLLIAVFNPPPEQRQGLTMAFLLLLIWILLNGTDVAKGFLGGMAFKTLAAFTTPFQLGDRVTIKGTSGKVVGFTTFFVSLQTVNDDLVSIPTHTLWGEDLVSANAGERSSLAVIPFYLAPWATAAQCREAEDIIWDAIQASTYFEPNKPMQIYIAQAPTTITLTAKAYVASTYMEPLFASDITRAFLAAADEKGIPLASPQGYLHVPGKSGAEAG